MVQGAVVSPAAPAGLVQDRHGHGHGPEGDA